MLVEREQPVQKLLDLAKSASTGRGAIALVGGEAAEAGHFAGEAVRVLEDTPPSSERAMAYSLRSQLHLLNDRMDEAAVWATRLGVKLPAEFDVRLPAPCAAEIKGDYDGTASAWESLGAPYSAALCLIQAGEGATTPTIARAIKLLEPLEARAAASKARKIARDLGLARQMPRSRRGHYGAAKNHPLGLTRREQDILALVENGATNRDISEALARSQRTIEHHVSSVLSKLNVANRMKAMLRVQNEPWLLPDQGNKDITRDRK